MRERGTIGDSAGTELQQELLSMTLAKCNKHDETLPGPWPSRLDLPLHGTTNSVGDTRG
jgi:hypothetical protein